MTTRIISHGNLTWLDLAHPSEADVGSLRERFPYFHPLNLEDIRSPIERPKLDQDDVYLFMVMHFPLWDSRHELSRAAEVDFFVGHDFLVTVHNGTLKPLVDLVERCQSDGAERERLLGRGANHAFHTLTLLRRDIISLRRIIRQQIPIVQQLESVDHAILHDHMVEYFGDIADHLFKLRDIADENYEIINSFAESADTLASYRINEVMRILTVISVIMLPLTLISSIYGMNIELPFAEDPHAFIITAGIMIMIVILMLVYFRRRNWL